MANLTEAVHELGVLKHVSYVLEAFACGATREGRHELAALIAFVEGDALLDQDCQTELLKRLRSAYDALSEPRSPAGTLSEMARASSFLWDRVVPGWMYARRN